MHGVLSQEIAQGYFSTLRSPSPLEPRCKDRHYVFLHDLQFRVKSNILYIVHG